MSRDRLAEAKAASKDTYQTELEMSNLQATRLGPPGQGDSYLSDISNIKADIESFKGYITKINSLNDQSLNLISEQQQQEHTREADRATSEATSLMQTIKANLQALLNLKLSDSSQNNIKHGQYVILKKQFMEYITQYLKVEQKHRQQVKDRMARQYRIVRPDATEEEIKEALDGDNNSSIFAQSVLNSARAGEAKRALKEVQDRHMDIQNIVKNIEQLNSLYQKMQMMVEEDEVKIEEVQKNVIEANTNMEEVNVQLEQATDLARGTRKKKFILLGIFIVVLIIIIIIIATQFAGKK